MKINLANSSEFSKIHTCYVDPILRIVYLDGFQ